MKIRLFRIARFGWTLCVYGDTTKNPLLSIGHGWRPGWMIQTRNHQWLSPKLKKSIGYKG